MRKEESWRPWQVSVKFSHLPFMVLTPSKIIPARSSPGLPRAAQAVRGLRQTAKSRRSESAHRPLPAGGVAAQQRLTKTGGTTTKTPVSSGVDTPPRPQLDSAVFIKVHQMIEDIRLSDPTDESKEEIVDLQGGSQHIIPYRAIAPYVRTGEVTLI
ncbi:unnamed protein product [Soboliphyme baturini]|uniref:SLD5_C domain-containing protein n=1 Tax=Soboliphyme baturini TaxID=241478 RepID=A0A183IUK6_9BILA|nr:unnamed protein product [Soboliphyme baturini]